MLQSLKYFFLGSSGLQWLSLQGIKLLSRASARAFSSFPVKSVNYISGKYYRMRCHMRERHSAQGQSIRQVGNDVSLSNVLIAKSLFRYLNSLKVFGFA